nr:hypothetical protein [Tanacetum cinerariifolium]
MDTTIDEYVAMDEALVPRAQRLRIRRSNFQLLSDIKSKESTLQLVYDATATSHHHAIRFKMDNKKHIVNLESFRDMLHICMRVHGQTFDKPPFEEEILAFIRFLGHSVPIRTLTDVNINKLYQPWRSFAAIINKRLTGKSSGYDSLRLSQAQILWGLYHKRNVDYAYLMWEDFVYQDPSIQKRNKVNWYYVSDDFMFSRIKLVSRHQNTQQFGALLPIELTNDEIRNSNDYKENYAVATGEAAPKPKASVRRTRSGSDTSITPPTAAASPRLTASTKGKQTAKASKAKRVLYVPTDESEEELLCNSTDDEGVDEEGKDGDDDKEDEGDDDEEGNGDEDDDGEEGDDDDDDNQEVVKKDDKNDAEESRDDDKEGEGDKQEYNEEEDDEETKDEESFDPIPQTPKRSGDDGNEAVDIGLNLGDEEEHVEEEEEYEIYKDVNINQERGLQATLEVEDTHVTLTPVKPDGQQESSSVSSQFVTSMLNLTLDVGMESIFEITSRIDVQNPTSVAPLPITTPTMTSSTIATTTTTSQAPILPTTVPSDIIQNLPSFGSLFCFDDRLRSLEENFSKVMQTNQFAGAVSAIPKIVQQYMDQRMNEAVKIAVQIQSDRLRDEAQRENDEFLRTVDENIKKIIKEQVKEQVKVQVSKILLRIEQLVNEQLQTEVLTRSSHSSRTSYAIAADLSKMELKKILIEKMEGNKSIQCSDKQRNLYKALVDAYESDKIILDTYRETVTLKRRRDDDLDKDEEPSTGPDRGSKRRREGKEPESASTPSETATRSTGRSITGSRSRQASVSESALAEEHVQTTSQMEEPSRLEFDTCVDDQPIIQPSQHPECELAKQADTRSSFIELMDTPMDFSNFIMNRLRVDTLTSKLLAGPTYDLMKGSCKSLIELEYNLEEVYKATTDQLDWVKPEGQQYPHNLLQPLLLIPDNRGRRVIPFAHFIINDLEYLRGGASSRKYTTSVTKTKAADYGHIKWIEDLVPRTMWIQEPIDSDKHALWGVSHWGRKRQQFYGFAVNQESAHDVYSKRRIIAVTELKIVEWHSYKHLDWITVRRDDDKLYKFKEGNFKRLRIQDIEDMLLLLVQGKLTNLTIEERFAFNVSLQMFTRSIVIQRCMEDLQLGVKSYQKRLNLTKPDTYRSDLKRKEAYTAYSNPRGFIYQNKDKKNRLMRIDELHKFSDGTLTDVRTALDDRLKGIRMRYLPQTIWRKSDKDRPAAMIQAIDKRLKTRRVMRSLERFVGGRMYEGDFMMLQRTI